MHALRRFLEKLDDAVYRLERVLLLVSLAMMTVLIFSDVVLRSFTRPVGKTAQLLTWLVERGGPLSAEARARVADVWGPALFGVLALGTCIFAASARAAAKAHKSGEPAQPFARSLAQGLVLFVVLLAAVKAMVWGFPTGIAGAQKLALGFMVWAGFLGASMATKKKRHILLDAVKKKLDDATYPWFSALGGVATAAFTLTLTYLAVHKLSNEIEEWAAVPNVGVFESVPIPVWVVTLALPVAFGLVALRFFAYGLADLLYGAQLVTEPDELAVEMKKLEERETEAPPAPPLHSIDYGRAHDLEHGRPLKREAEG